MGNIAAGANRSVSSHKFRTASSERKSASHGFISRRHRPITRGVAKSDSCKAALRFPASFSVSLALSVAHSCRGRCAGPLRICRRISHFRCARRHPGFSMFSSNAALRHRVQTDRHPKRRIRAGAQLSNVNERRGASLAERHFRVPVEVPAVITDCAVPRTKQAVRDSLARPFLAAIAARERNGKHVASIAGKSWGCRVLGMRRMETPSRQGPHNRTEEAARTCQDSLFLSSCAKRQIHEASCLGSDYAS